MKVIAYDPIVTTTELNVRLTDRDEVLNSADFLSLHIPKQPFGPAIGAAEIEIMKRGAYLINCARGGVVDEGALLEALNNGHLGGAGIDVFEQEPTSNLDLIRHPKVSATPHTGASTIEAQERVGAEVALLLKEYFK